MRTITLNIRNENDYQILFGLVKRLGIELSNEPEDKENTSVAQYHRLKKLLTSVKKNELFKKIRDPVRWQKQLRDEWE